MVGAARPPVVRASTDPRHQLIALTSSWLDGRRRMHMCGSWQARGPVDVRLLGPVAVHVDGHRVEIRPPQRLLVLAALAVDAGRVVPIDTVIGRVWDKPPNRARAALYAHISHLRAVLRQAAAGSDPAPAQVIRQGPG